MAPGATVKLTRSSALTPAKRTVTSRTASSGTSTPSRACRWVVTRPTESGACGYAGLRHVRVLLDQQHRRTLPVDLGDDLPDLGNHARREAQRGLVEQQQLRCGRA